MTKPELTNFRLRFKGKLCVGSVTTLYPVEFVLKLVTLLVGSARVKFADSQIENSTS